MTPSNPSRVCCAKSNPGIHHDFLSFFTWNLWWSFFEYTAYIYNIRFFKCLHQCIIHTFLSIYLSIYPILSYPILSYPILSYPILSYPILSYPILSYPILSIYLSPATSWHFPSALVQVWEVMSGVEAALKVGGGNWDFNKKRSDRNRGKTGDTNFWHVGVCFFLPLLGARKVKKHRNQREFVGDLISLFFLKSKNEFPA